MGRDYGGCVVNIAFLPAAMTVILLPGAGALTTLALSKR